MTPGVAARPRHGRFGGSFSPARSSTSTAILRGSTVRTASPQSFRFGRQIVVGHNAVASIMHELGIKGLPKRRMPRSARVGAVAGADLVRRQFTRAAPDQLWMTDITEHPTREGKIYCCVVLDAFSRRVVGWSIDSSQTTVLVTNALGWPHVGATPPRASSSTPTAASNSRPGVQPESPRCRPRAVDRGDRMPIRQRRHRSLLGTHANRATQPRILEEPHRAGLCDPRLHRALPQPPTPPLST